MSERHPTCPSPLTWETLVAYWAGDLPPEEEEAAELHLMSCAACTRESQRVSQVTEAVRTSVASPVPALTVVQGERRDAPPPPARASAPRRRARWFLGGAGAATLVAAAAIFLLVPRAALVSSHVLPAPVRDAVAVELSPAPDAREVRLEPEVPRGVTVNGARLRRLDGGWLSARVEAGPPFAVVVARADLPPGRYELELVSVTPEGAETSRGFYRFSVTPPR